MKKIPVLIIFLLIITSCSNESNKTAVKLTQLKKERDYLATILEDINNNKYVFDSISFRDTHNPKNTYLPNSYFEMELLVVGQSPRKHYFIKYDSISEGRLVNPDTLPIVNGGYKLKTKLMRKENPIWVDMNIKNEYGKTKKGHCMMLSGRMIENENGLPIKVLINQNRNHPSQYYRYDCSCFYSQ